MARKDIRRRMSDEHEADLQHWLGGRRTRGSGNQAPNQMDGRHDARREPFAFAWDGKSTLGKSISLSEEMWDKAVEQCHGELPMIALRWYRSENLEPDLDLGAINLHDLVEMREQAVRFRRLYGLLQQVDDGGWLIQNYENEVEVVLRALDRQCEDRTRVDEKLGFTRAYPICACGWSPDPTWLPTEDDARAAWQKHVDGLT